LERGERAAEKVNRPDRFPLLIGKFRACKASGNILILAVERKVWKY
jgi:hypothetical protein